jgi:hypothetical protein
MKNGMADPFDSSLHPRHTPGAAVSCAGSGWRLQIPARSSRREYCLAQMDDYSAISRRAFPHSPPVSLSLLARVSQADLPGTWGFGFWNDPFGLSIGLGGFPARLPILPNAAWFFHASPPNWLSLHDSIPARGFFAGTNRSAHIPSLLPTPAPSTLRQLDIRLFSRILRRLASRFIQQDAELLQPDVTAWHQFSIIWLCEACEFRIDGKTVLKTPISPRSPLGLVIWIDNQFAAWDPQGRLGSGTLENPSAWLEIADIKTW